MIVYLVIGTLAGVGLGLRFKVLVLFPAMLLAAVVTISAGIASGHASSAIALALFGTLLSLQFGYVVGCVVQAYLPIRTPREASNVVIKAGLSHH